MRSFPGLHHPAVVCTAVLTLLAVAPAWSQNSTDILAYHAGALTSVGVNASEQQITPASISGSTFGKLFTTDITDIPNVTGIPSSTLPSGTNYTAPAGQVYAEPLVKTGVNITTGSSQGLHDVVFVATSMDSLFAIDAAGGSVLWKDSFIYNAGGNPNPLNPAVAGGITACPGGFNTETNSQDISPWIGIVSTPVIDGVNGYLYLVAKTREVRGGDQTHPHYVLTLHKVRLADGLDTSAVMADTTLQTSDNTFTFNAGPYIVGTGEAAISVSGQSRIYLNAVRHMVRPALELYNGRIYVAAGSHGDNQPYHGWVLTYDAATLACNGAWNPTPNSSEGEGGIWQGGGGVVIDSNGYIYFEMGNGGFDGQISTGNVVSGLDSNGFPVNGDYGDCFVKLAVDTTTQGNQDTNKNGWGLKVVDYFAPYNNHKLDSGDTDLGSGGPTILPDSAGSTAHPHLLVGGGKEGKLYLIDRDNMGKFGTTDNVVQTFASALNATFSVPAYFNGRLYATAGYGGNFSSWPLAGATIATASGQNSPDQIAFPGCSPSITANGTANGVAWVIDKGTGQLRAYDAANLATELWTSNKDATRDALGSAVKFAVPTVANGRVYVGTADHLVVYGPPIPATAPPAAPTALNTAATGPSTVALAWTDNSNNENSFRIERSSDGVNFSEVGTVGANQTTYGDSGLSSQAAYSYRVRAANLYNTLSFSAYSNVSSATTPGVGSQLPINFYHFDEGAAMTALDSVSGNNGILSGAPLPGWIAPGRIGSFALSFSGNGLYNQTGSVGAFNFGFDAAGASGIGWSFGANGGANVSEGSPNGVSFHSPGQSTAVGTGSASLSSTPLGVGTYDIKFVAAQTTGTPADVRITVTDSLGKAVFSTTTRDYTLSSPVKTWTQYDFPFNITDAPANDYLIVSFSSDAKTTAYFGWDTLTGTFTPTFQSAVRVATDLAPTLGTTSSLLFWINTTQAGNNTHWMAPAITGVEQGGNSNDIAWGTVDATGHIGVAVGDSGSVLSKTAVNDGKWHHIGLSRDATAGTVKVYVDGVLSTSGTLQTGNKTSPFRLLGARSVLLGDGVTFTGGNYFQGQLDDVRIYNLAVDPAVVASLALPPAAPTQLVVTPASGTELDLTWLDNANNETGYEVWRSISGGAWVRTAQLAANAVSYMDVSLTQGTSYAYFVRAVASAGSTDSAIVSSATPVPPQTPTGATVTFLSSNEVDLQWNDNAANETGYKILRGSASGGNFNLVATLSANSTRYNDTGVQPGVTYEYHIQAYNVAGVSDFTGLSITTPTQYQSYLAGYFTAQQLTDPTITGDTADPDHDGISNLVEYAFGSDPTKPSLSSLPTSSIQNGYLTISFIQRVAPTDVSYTVEVSGDMVTWNSGANYTTQVSATPVDSATQRVVVRDQTQSKAAVRRFIRVKILH